MSKQVQKDRDNQQGRGGGGGGDDELATSHKRASTYINVATERYERVYIE